MKYFARIKHFAKSLFQFEFVKFKFFSQNLGIDEVPSAHCTGGHSGILERIELLTFSTL